MRRTGFHALWIVKAQVALYGLVSCFIKLYRIDRASYYTVSAASAFLWDDQNRVHLFVSLESVNRTSSPARWIFALFTDVRLSSQSIRLHGDLDM
jgi:hypothetical protein